MPGSNAGTGQPITFRCWVQRRGAEIHYHWRTRKISYISYPKGHNGVRTGKVRASARGGGIRMMHTDHQYRCECGHVGWSKHTGVLYWPLAE